MNNQTNWITVESRLPDHGQTVLIVYGSDPTVSIATFHHCAVPTWDDLQGKEEYSPDFWMPLPEAPPKPDLFEEWWNLTPVSSDLTMKEWCRIAWREASSSERK